MKNNQFENWILLQETEKDLDIYPRLQERWKQTNVLLSNNYKVKKPLFVRLSPYLAIAASLVFSIFIIKGMQNHRSAENYKIEFVHLENTDSDYDAAIFNKLIETKKIYN